MSEETRDEVFENPPPHEGESRLLVDLDGYEGPLDVLLALARDQKVDLTKISILQLAEQYLEFVARARRLRLEIAADYLVMAAWLAYLKSRLLLPPPEDEGEEPTGAEMAAALAFQLRRLEAMREAGVTLMARPQLGREVFARGVPEELPVIRNTVFDVSLFELLSAYGRQHRRKRGETYRVSDPVRLFSIEDALARLSGTMGQATDWRTLAAFLPVELLDPLSRRSALAATFGASLELAKQGRVQLRQDSAFAPLYVRARQSSA